MKRDLTSFSMVETAADGSDDDEAATIEPGKKLCCLSAQCIENEQEQQERMSEEASKRLTEDTAYPSNPNECPVTNNNSAEPADNTTANSEPVSASVDPVIEGLKNMDMKSADSSEILDAAAGECCQKC